ncbi:zinc-dependent alcohol dehydrogenase [Deinococcus puniceus]|uniref:zinc-dependent alcohol dehydrogenase n=1 Tax=Deinococcus puniceus TaxID=1182568 RepID=UPI001E58F826|nr:zinc-binding alcohol dehydrogenase [Deinococcus puniceus]
MSVASELSVVDGRTAHALPYSLGYQSLGVVEQAGAGVDLAVGTRVVAFYGHASAAIAQASRCIEVPTDITDRTALAAVLGEETAKGIRKVAPRPDERVLIAGAGLLGLLTIFNLTRLGIQDVTVLEPDPERRTLARLFGAEALRPGKTDHDQFDVGFECSASPAGFSELLTCLRPHARACVLSDGNWGQLALPAAFHERELSLVASSDGDNYHAYAAWLWVNAHPLLERLFEVTVSPAELIPMFERLRRWPRPVSVVADWTRGTAFE